MVSLAIFLFVAFLMLFLGGTVFLHNTRDRVHRYFLFFGILVAVWMTANYLENVQALPAVVREFFLRMDFAAGILASAGILLFVVNFIDRKVPLQRSALYFVPAVILAALSFTKLLLPMVFFAPTGEIQFTEGIVFYFYAPALLAYFIIPCIMLFRERRRATPTMRGQMTAIGTGLVATTIVTLGVNLFLQNVLSADWFRIGIYAFLFFISGVAWAIAKHEFLNIRFVVVEVLFLGILATMLTRTILSRDLEDLAINLASFVILLVLWLFMVRTFLNEDRQRVELLALTQELSRKNEQLKETDKLKSEFVSIASHQLRTPISVLKGYLSLILDGAYGPVEGAMRDKVAAMVDMSERLALMVTEMLNVSRIERNKIAFTCGMADLVAAAREIVGDFQERGTEQGIPVRLVADRGPALAFVDADKVKEVLSNLIDNALKYSSKGSVDVTVRPRPSRQDVLVTVSDEGMGIAADDLKHLFEKFYRASSTEVSHLPGTGLGLYVCRVFIRGMGGDIWVERTAVGQGTVFAFSVPMSAKGECAPKLTSPIHPQAER